MENKRKRIKLECLNCGGVFNNDYRAKHEHQQHDGKRVKVKHFGEPKNPLEASKLLPNKYSITKTSTISTAEVKEIEHSSDETNIDSTFESLPCQLEITEKITTGSTMEEKYVNETIENLLDAIETDVIKNKEYQNTHDYLETQDNNNNEKNTESWIDSVGKLSSLLQVVNECKSFLKKVNDNDISNPIYFLTTSIELISSVKEKSVLYIQSASNVLLKEFALEKHVCTNEKVIDKLLAHDPGKRGKVESASQRNYLLSLGPYQPLEYVFPTNYDISKGKQRKFNLSWFKEYPHFEYSILNNAAFCFICSIFPNRAWAEHSWTLDGVRTWSKMKSRGKGKPGKLEVHFSSNTHKSALVDLISL